MYIISLTSNRGGLGTYTLEVMYMCVRRIDFDSLSTTFRQEFRTYLQRTFHITHEIEAPQFNVFVNDL